jgi:phosphoribosylformylglycinamidine synthase
MSSAPRGTKSAPRAALLRTAGTNCDRETAVALDRAGARVSLVHVQELVDDPARLGEFDLAVIPGGFSYGDDVAAGRILGYELRQHVAPELRAFVERGGLVLGVCNGFQVLVDTGLLESPDAHGERALSLAANERGRFECRWITLRSEPSACTWLTPGEVWPAPVAHGEGRLCVRDAAVLDELRAKGQIALRYVHADGSPARGYPDSPNGSIDDIAGLCDPTGRVLGLMPHPERNVSPWHHPRWTRLAPRAEGEGMSFYRRMVERARESAPFSVRAKSAQRTP